MEMLVMGYNVVHYVVDRKTFCHVDTWKKGVNPNFIEDAESKVTCKKCLKRLSTKPIVQGLVQPAKLFLLSKVSSLELSNEDSYETSKTKSCEI